MFVMPQKLARSLVSYLHNKTDVVDQQYVTMNTLTNLIKKILNYDHGIEAFLGYNLGIITDINIKTA